MRILLNFASRSRPEKFKACLDNIRQTAKGEVFILAKLDYDDPENYPRYGYDGLSWGSKEGKIKAINRDIPGEFDIIMNHSDDMWFIEHGWDEIVKNDFQTYFPDLDGVLHYPDGHANGLLTYSIIGRKYYKRDGFIYHPDFVSLWADNLAQELAIKRGKYKFIDRQIFEHRHPVWGLSPMDAQYQEQNTYQSDRLIYERLKKEYGL